MRLREAVARGSWRATAEPVLLPLAVSLFAGAHLAGLVLFLNPRLPFDLARLARGAAVYGALLAPLSLAGHWLIAWRTRRPVRRIVPWTLTAIAAAAALGDWVHASYWSFYLPSGINEQLIKAALWLTAGALLVFYTALLHSLHGRRYGPRSRWFLVLIACGTVYAMVQRRERFAPAPLEPLRRPAPAEEAMPSLAAVVLPGATLDAVLPLTEQGKLPFFASLLESGVRARLASLAPVRPLALEATLATGKLPHRHGLESETLFVLPWLGGEEPLRLLPVATGFARWGLPGGTARRVTRADRTALPLWEVLALLGRPATALGFPSALAGGDGQPAPAAESAAERELVAAGAPALAVALGRDRAGLAAARSALGDGAGRAVFVRLAGLEQASLQSFGAFAAVEFEGARAGRVQRAAAPLTAYYAALDRELESVWLALPEPRLLVVASAYGVSAPAGLARIVRDVAGRQRLEGGFEGAPDGLLLLRGEGVRLGLQISGASITDVVPTLLYALGLPAARDLDGKVLGAAFEPGWLQRRPLSFVPSYDGLANDPLSGP